MILLSKIIGDMHACMSVTELSYLERSISDIYACMAFKTIYYIFKLSIRPLQIDFLFPVLAKQNLACGRAVNSIIPLY